MEPVQNVATELVAEQAPGALHVIAEERGSDGKEPDGAAVELETPDVADAMSELRLHSILFFSFNNAEADFANHRIVARAVPIHANCSRQEIQAAKPCWNSGVGSSTLGTIGEADAIRTSVVSCCLSGQDYPVRCPGHR